VIRTNRLSAACLGSKEGISESLGDSLGQASGRGPEEPDVVQDLSAGQLVKKTGKIYVAPGDDDSDSLVLHIKLVG
jgi:hypothetical protein